MRSDVVDGAKELLEFFEEPPDGFPKKLIDSNWMKSRGIRISEKFRGSDPLGKFNRVSRIVADLC